MVTIYPAPLAHPTSSAAATATRDQLRDESENGMKTRAADQLVHTELNLSNISALVKKRD